MRGLETDRDRERDREKALEAFGCAVCVLSLVGVSLNSHVVGFVDGFGVCSTHRSVRVCVRVLLLLVHAMGARLVARLICFAQTTTAPAAAAALAREFCSLK